MPRQSDLPDCTSPSIVLRAPVVFSSEARISPIRLALPFVLSFAPQRRSPPSKLGASDDQIADAGVGSLIRNTGA